MELMPRFVIPITSSQLIWSSSDFIRSLVPPPSQFHSFIHAIKMGIASDFFWIHPLTSSHLAQSQIYRPSTTHTSQWPRHACRHQPFPSHIPQCITSAVLLRVVHHISPTQHQWPHNPMSPCWTLTPHYLVTHLSLLELPWASLSPILVELGMALPVNRRAHLNRTHTPIKWTQTHQMKMGMRCLM